MVCRYDTSRREYRHTFVPFFMAIINEECYEVYHHLITHLDMLVRALTSGERGLSDVVNLCVHDAHQGAIKACNELLPDVRNGRCDDMYEYNNIWSLHHSARCYFHLSKNFKDNRGVLGDAFPIVSYVLKLELSFSDVSRSCATSSGCTLAQLMDCMTYSRML